MSYRDRIFTSLASLTEPLLLDCGAGATLPNGKPVFTHFELVFEVSVESTGTDMAFLLPLFLSSILIFPE